MKTNFKGLWKVVAGGHRLTGRHCIYKLRVYYAPFEEWYCISSGQTGGCMKSVVESDETVGWRISFSRRKDMIETRGNTAVALHSWTQLLVRKEMKFDAEHLL